jgi:hypothetical protein
MQTKRGFAGGLLTSITESDVELEEFALLIRGPEALAFTLATHTRVHPRAGCYESYRQHKTSLDSRE